MQVQSSDQQWQQMAKQVQPQKSLFTKIKVDFDDQKINQNLQLENSKPNFHKDDQQQQETELIQVERGQEALYNALEDDENQMWVQKKILKRQTAKRPLICPACFIQIAFSYQIASYGQSKNTKNSMKSQLETITEPKNIYYANKVSHIVVDQTKIIRSKSNSQMRKWQGMQFDEAQQHLSNLKQQFNVRIVCFCQCGVQIGLYDVNRHQYCLFNVV